MREPSYVSMREELTLRVHGPANLPTLIYLPGLHGDWTLIGGFRRALGARVRFVEVTYPRTLTWTLDDYAAAIERALKEQGIEHAWLLGESFGSQLVWPLLARKSYRTDAVILAGGFVRHPTPKTAGVVGRVTAGLPFPAMRLALAGYAKLMRVRYRRSPEVLENLDEFMARRTDLDRRAIAHRLDLLARNDPGPTAQAAGPPVFALTGMWDPIVPWFHVRRWLRDCCPSLQDYRVLWQADHQVLGTAPETAARVIMGWITGTLSGENDQPSRRSRMFGGGTAQQRAAGRSR